MTCAVLYAAPGDGGKTDKYEWIQSLSGLSATVPVPPGTKSKMLDITIAKRKLKVAIVIIVIIYYYFNYFKYFYYYLIDSEIKFSSTQSKSLKETAIAEQTKRAHKSMAEEARKLLYCKE